MPTDGEKARCRVLAMSHYQFWFQHFDAIWKAISWSFAFTQYIEVNGQPWQGRFSALKCLFTLFWRFDAWYLWFSFAHQRKCFKAYIIWPFIILYYLPYVFSLSFHYWFISFIFYSHAQFYYVQYLPSHDDISMISLLRLQAFSYTLFAIWCYFIYRQE